MIHFGGRLPRLTAARSARRAPLRRLAAGCLLAAAPLWCQAASPWSGSPTEPLSMEKVAPGIYTHEGRQEETTAANHGDIANVSFIVGQRCVAVVDTGGSENEGAALRAAVRQVTPLPVCYVINTHMHPDHVFGNAAFKADHATFVGSATLPEALSARHDVYTRALERELGKQASGSVLIAPTLTVKDQLELDLGGRKIALRAWKTAHTNNDVTVFDPTTGTLFTGDLLVVKRTPAIDGSIVGWLADLKTMRALTPRHVVPGHGPVDPPWPGALDAQAHYLEVIATGVRAALKDGKTIEQAVATVGQSERDKWLLFDNYHHRNVTAAYSELEWE